MHIDKYSKGRSPFTASKTTLIPNEDSADRPPPHRSCENGTGVAGVLDKETIDNNSMSQSCSNNLAQVSDCSNSGHFSSNLKNMLLQGGFSHEAAIKASVRRAEARVGTGADPAYTPEDAQVSHVRCSFKSNSIRITAGGCSTNDSNDAVGEGVGGGNHRAVVLSSLLSLGTSSRLVLSLSCTCR